jgi:hypothetical protein
MWILVRIAQDAADRGVITSELLGDVAVKVLGRNNIGGAAGVLCGRGHGEQG